MDNPTRIATLDNEVQAGLLSSLLNEEGIVHQICSYRDSAYDGLFQTERGWGHIEADKRNEPRILEIIAALKSQNSDGS